MVRHLRAASSVVSCSLGIFFIDLPVLAFTMSDGFWITTSILARPVRRGGFSSATGKACQLPARFISSAYTARRLLEATAHVTADSSITQCT